MRTQQLPTFVLFVLLISLASPTFGCSLCEDSSNIPRHSDVCFTSRSYHPHPIGNPNTFPKLNTWEAAKAFYATRIDWVYNDDKAFYHNATKRHLRTTAAVNSNLPDKPGSGTYDVGRIRDIHGHKITAPWMRAWKNPPYWGCANHPEYLDIVLTAAKTLLSIGATAIQHDDPGINAESVRFGGCYCSRCMSLFTPYVLSNVSHTIIHELNITKSWNYREFLLNPKHNKKYDTDLRQAFVTFQGDSSTNYQRTLRKKLFSAKYGVGRPVTMSCNNGVRNWWGPYGVFDYGLGELSEVDATPEKLYSLLVEKVPAGKKQVTTMPKWDHEPTVGEKHVIQIVAGFAYSVGTNMLVPWDIYLPTPHAQRYYGNVSDYAPLFKFARDNAVLLDGFDAVYQGLANTSMIKVNQSDVYVFPRTNTNATTQELTVLHVSDWTYCGVNCTHKRAARRISVNMKGVLHQDKCNCIQFSLLHPATTNRMPLTPNCNKPTAGWVEVVVPAFNQPWGMILANATGCHATAPAAEG